MRVQRFLLVAFMILAGRVFAADQNAPVDFRRDVLPILVDRCVACHNDNESKGGLNLSNAKGMLAGGDTGPCIVPGNVDESWVLELLRAKDDEPRRMPKKGTALSGDEINFVSRWIAQGAKWPDGVVLQERPKVDASWWSLRKLDRVPVPPVDSQFGVANQPIDAFILQRLQEKGLRPSPPAEREVVIRRLGIGLLGLPPSAEEVERFVTDDRPDAYERLVDRSMASPSYGERWARHWLDVVRFAESDGFETNQPRPNAWRYRDYVIESWNADKPYDRFVQEQIAGDSLDQDVATGFLVGGPYDRVKSPDPVLTAQQRADELHDMVSTTGSAILGLTVGCARCHNHKFDPIAQSDYYAIKACLSGVQHGERPLRAADETRRQTQAASLRKELEPIQRAIVKFEPWVYRGRIMLLDDATPGTSDINRPFVTELLPPQGTANLAAGADRGAADDTGNTRRLPNLSKTYKWWSGVKGKNVFSWSPKLAGRYRIWASWGCGWDSHATDAHYVLDRDGNLDSADDRVDLAQVDQRQFSDGTSDGANRSRWSGFRAIGDQLFSPESRVILRAGDSDSAVTADVMLFQEIGSVDDTAQATLPERSLTPPLRNSVTRDANVERFQPVDAKFVRFTILAGQSEPCIDELEVFDAESPARNVALRSAGTQTIASGTLAGFAIHKLEHINDGLYGNEHSWISNESGKGWVQLEFPKVERIGRIVWSRDRDPSPRFADRVATRYLIESSLDRQTWTKVASSDDRLPIDYPVKVVAIPTIPGLSQVEEDELVGLVRRQKEIQTALQELTIVPVAYAGRLTSSEPTFRLHRGDPTQPREPQAPGVITSFGPTWSIEADVPDPVRRLELAKWLVHPDNPLPPRVLVNRLWHYQFGRGIVDTPSDFGFGGGRPTHPELLDWLAGSLIDQGWSIKAVQRQMVLSATYRQASLANTEAARVDGDSRFLWRYPPRRLEAEVLRDAMLRITGSLDGRMGGPGFDLFEPNTNYVKVYNSKKSFQSDTFRRMVYQSKPRMQLDDTFGAFDCPDAGQIAPRRNRSITPLQALNLLNSPFALQQANAWAESLETSVGRDPESRVSTAFRDAFGREPNEDEIAESRRFIDEYGLVAFCRAMMNANEFLFVF